MGDNVPTPVKKRRSRAELKELMINAGVEVLHDVGVEVQISSVSYARVFEHLEKTEGVRVTYGSVHERIWDSLQEYQLAVIERSALWDSPGNELGPRPAGDGWNAWLRSIVSMTSQAPGPVPDAAAAGARRHYAAHEERVANAASEATSGEGLVAKDAFGDDAHIGDVMARLSIAIAEGLALRTSVTGQREPTIMMRTEPDDELEEWTYHALAMWGLERAFFHTDEPGGA